MKCQIKQANEVGNRPDPKPGPTCGDEAGRDDIGEDCLPDGQTEGQDCAIDRGSWQKGSALAGRCKTSDAYGSKELTQNR